MAALVSKSLGMVRGRIARFTLVDVCGFPQITNSMYVTDGFVQVQQTKNMDTGDTINVRGANGIVQEYEPGRVSLLNFSIQIQLIRVDPAALVMLTGDPLVLDYAGAAVGWEEKAGIQLLNNFAMEVWTASSGAACSSAQPLGGYMLYPMVGQAYVDIDNVTDKEVTATIKGLSYGNPSWGKGPYGDSPTDGSSVPGPVGKSVGPPVPPGRLVAPVSALAHRHFEVTPIQPPAAFTTPGPISITLPTSY